ncbi:Os06g0270100 [Oryza sativa Japonica Group]|uniref:Os06g0270100 protein n=1 Tax=Oryza sativa subsp. japonica TaxID=39947 RepID=A0A0P0WV26_ORYSJ|nr:Os06g0270100 [Oryza sativa Japonica Group]
MVQRELSRARTGDDVALFVELPLLWSLAARSSEDNEAAAAAPSSSPDPALGSLDLASNTILGVTHLLRVMASLAAAASHRMWGRCMGLLPL